VSPYVCWDLLGIVSLGLPLNSPRSAWSIPNPAFDTARTDTNKLSMGQLALQLSDVYNSQREAYLHSICTDIEALTGDNQAKLAWAAINKLTCRKSRSNGIVTAEDNIDRLKLWHAHYKTLLSPDTPSARSNLNLPKVFHDIPFRTGELTIDELDTGLAALTCDKAAGVDEIVNEILRRPELADCLLDILNMCYASKTVPNEWHISLLVPVFKKGNPSMCTNYRGIALMSTCAKLYNRLLLGRIRDGLDSHLRQNQNGFRPLRSTGQHVLAWRRIYEEVIATKFASLFSTFIDFSKAFDSVDWNYIENIMPSWK